MTSQNRAANNRPKQLTLALDITSPSAAETRHPLTRRQGHPCNLQATVARIDLAVYVDTPDEVGAVHIHWTLAGGDSGRPRVVPMQMCPECDRGFRAPEPGLCRDCREDAVARAQQPVNAPS